MAPKKKKATDPLMQELRRILMGLFYVDESGMIMVSDHLFRMQGMLNGADAIMTRGLYREQLVQEISGDLQETLKNCVRALENMGKPIRLQAAEHTVGVLHFSVLLNPSVITIEKVEDRLRISFYTAKTLTAPLNARRTLERLLQELPGGNFMRISSTVEAEEE